MIDLLDTNILIDLSKTVRRRWPSASMPSATRTACHVVHHLGRAAAGICEHDAVQATALKRRATPIGANDLWIACHALAIGATLVSHNVSAFSRVEGLQLEDWAV